MQRLSRAGHSEAAPLIKPRLGADPVRWPDGPQNNGRVHRRLVFACSFAGFVGTWSLPVASSRLRAPTRDTSFHRPLFEQQILWGPEIWINTKVWWTEGPILRPRMLPRGASSAQKEQSVGDAATSSREKGLVLSRCKGNGHDFDSVFP